MTDDLMLQHLPVSDEEAWSSDGAAMPAAPLAGGTLQGWPQELALRDILAAFIVSGEAMACAS